MTISEIIRGLMQAKKVTQVQMAQFLNLSGQSSARRRLDSSNPTIDSLTEILDVLGYEVVIQPKRQGRRADGQIVLIKGMGAEKK